MSISFGACQFGPFELALFESSSPLPISLFVVTNSKCSRHRTVTAKGKNEKKMEDYGIGLSNVSEKIKYLLAFETMGSHAMARVKSFVFAIIPSTLHDVS